MAKLDWNKAKPRKPTQDRKDDGTKSDSLAARAAAAERAWEARGRKPVGWKAKARPRPSAADDDKPPWD